MAGPGLGSTRKCPGKRSRRIWLRCKSLNRVGGRDRDEGNDKSSSPGPLVPILIASNQGVVSPTLLQMHRPKPLLHPCAFTRSNKQQDLFRRGAVTCTLLALVDFGLAVAGSATSGGGKKSLVSTN